jgi:HD-like signal output (HDOD) protein
VSIELSATQIDNLMQGIKIPPQPQILIDLQHAQLDPDCTVETIASIVGRDAGLSGSVLKTVNSPLFGLSHQLTSIKQAVTRLGTRSVMSISQAFVLRCALSDDENAALGLFWDNANDVAQCCTLIANQIGYRNPEEAYCLGLFHNCAVPALLMRHSNYLDVVRQSYDLAASPTRRIIETENDTLHTNHAVVGYFIARAWNMPTYFCEAISEHHNTAQIFSSADHTDPHKKQLLAILKIAEHLCGTHRVLGKQDTDWEWDSCSTEVLLYAGLTDYDLENIAAQMVDMGMMTTH